ncbi:hypothetical protein [Novosphingobium sp. 9U]|uniref:hypothetical protein n=1 Tax=Novosphingobium sp. 9U TaxID=2653158 RepID=UPI0012F3ED57|nr:hypothetical protein [Novosphingobium sp. 9U]VWX54446.1 hypothetical protein NOVOSPHI9U_620032 [Novosphingobium sp. 9U]
MSKSSEFERLDDAFCNGRLAGLDRRSTVAACPFNHVRSSFRSAWLNGFAVGRIEGDMPFPSAAGGVGQGVPPGYRIGGHPEGLAKY